MPAPAWENLDAFLQPADFAVMADITLQGGQTRRVAVIFEDPFLTAKAGEYEADTTSPRITLKEADAVGISRGDTAVVNGVTYDVMNAFESDGTGMANITLEPR